MYTIPVALTPALPSELVTYLLTFESRPITLIACQPRDRFLQSLLQSIPIASPTLQPQPQRNDNETEPEEILPRNPFTRHQLLIPTIHQILTSRNINLIFVHSLSHLRAYLAVFHPSKRKDTHPRQSLNGGKHLLVIYGILELHRDTTEWSAQGLGQTLAGVVETSYHDDLSVELVEERTQQQRNEDAEFEELSKKELRKARRQEALQIWDEEVPVLSGGSSKKVAEGGWSGRKVEVGRILRRWFRFEPGLWDNM